MNGRLAMGGLLLLVASGAVLVRAEPVGVPRVLLILLAALGEIVMWVQLFKALNARRVGP